MLSWLTRSIALVLLALPAAAQGTVQLMLTGSVQNAKGTSIDVEFAVRAADGSEAQAVSLHVVLLGSTSASDVAALIAARLAEAKIRHVPPAAGGERDRATLFVDGVTRVLLRVGDGLGATIGLCGGAPISVQLLPPLARPGKASLLFRGTTQDVRLRQRGSIEFGVELQAECTPTQAVELLANACARANWLSERPSHETWKPSPNFEGLQLVGTSFALDTTAADWGIELRLP
jgi:hypothetical protein